MCGLIYFITNSNVQIPRQVGLLCLALEVVLFLCLLVYIEKPTFVLCLHLP